MVEGNIDGSGEKMQQLREAGNRRSVPTVRRSQLPKWAKEVSGKKWGKQKLGENRDQFFREKNGAIPSATQWQQAECRAFGRTMLLKWLLRVRPRFFHWSSMKLD